MPSRSAPTAPTKRKGGGAPPPPALRAVANDNDPSKPLAPFPMADRWPTILGSSLTLQYIAAVARNALQGYRMQWVDVLDELLDRTPHALSVLSQRILEAAGGRLDLTIPPGLEKGSADEQRATEIRDMVQQRLDGIPRFGRARIELLWGLYHGVSAQEILWDLRADGWWPAGLRFVHSRRLAYPNQAQLTPYIWDQGMVQPWSYGTVPTQGVYGLCIADYPNKFIFHAPQIRADYPTRGGLGRVISWYMALMLMAMRGAGDFVERFARPWAFARFSTKTVDNGGYPRVATGGPGGDIETAELVIKALGAGSLNAGIIPDSIEIDLKGPGVTGAANVINHEGLIALCCEMISKAVRGGTMMSDAGEKGARSLGEVQAEGDRRNATADAGELAETLYADLVLPIVRLNAPGEEHLAPRLTIHTEKQNPDALIARASTFAAMGGRPDAAALAAAVGIRQVDPDDPKARALVPLKPTDYFALLGADADGLPQALEALATVTGVSLTPTQKSALAALPPHVASQFVTDLLTRAAAGARAAAEGAAPADKTTPADAPASPTTPDQTTEAEPA